MNKLFPTSLFMLVLSALAFVVSGQAQENTAEKAPSKTMLKKYDADKDGKISAEEKETAKAEAQAKRAEKKAADLEKYDANKDGKLDKEERAKMKAEKDAAKEARKAEREAKKAEKKAGN